MSDVQWGPALAALAAGLIGGGVVAWRVYRSSRPTAPAGHAALLARDLEAKSEVLFRQLRELDDTVAKRSPEQLARERYALEIEAARALRELDRTGAEHAGAERTRAGRTEAGPAAIAAPPPASALRGFLWGAGTMSALGLLLFFVSRSAEVRKEGASVTGNLPGEERGARDADPELAELQAAVARAPEDVEARILLARAHLGRQDMMAVWNETKVILEKVPGEPRATCYQALVRLAMGQGDMAAEMIQKALAERPDFLEGYVHLAIVYSRTGRGKEAQAAIDGAAARFPDQDKPLRELWAKIRRDAPADGSAAVADAHADVAPPPAAGAAPPTSADTGSGVRGTVDVAQRLRGQVGGVLFVMLRRVGAAGGPPLAAKRIVASSFPVPFQIGPADSMMGEELPDAVRVEARLDTDGDPTTRDPADPVAKVETVKSGTAGLALVLDRAR